MLKSIVWNPLTISPIHGHNSEGCWVRMMEGSVHEQIFYPEEESPPELRSEKDVNEGEVTWLHNSIGFHLMQNQSESKRAVTLHLYHPPYDETKIKAPTGEVTMGKLGYYTYLGEKGETSGAGPSAGGV